jgi:2-oxoglutarate/2-oxoacid ferredoxin oxidoreductase subunit alpha
MRKTVHELSILLAGEAGAGINSTETVLTAVLKKERRHVFATKEFMSRVRGGTNSTTIRAASTRVTVLSGIVDIFIPLDADAFTRYGKSLQDTTLILADPGVIDSNRILPVAFNDIAESCGNLQYAGVVAAGTVAAIAGLSRNILADQIKSQFEKTGTEIVAANIQAADAGFEAGLKITADLGLKVHIEPADEVAEHIVVSGAEAVALGAIAAGCDAVFAYPMSPSTSTFAALAGWARQCGIALEQVEDEIGVINMALGAWYAGARAIVTTSGGGFALMTEGLSLSGITETPVVILLAQRPGPGTGLPTRTEQGNLLMAIHAGHGDFARAVFAPGTLEQGYEITRRAFDDADRFQIPAIILTDQYFVDSYYNTPAFAVPEASTRHIVEASEGYKRYTLDDGILSPRSVPGFGPGRVCVDSDEHDESGRITEDLDGISLRMKHRRAEKMRLVQDSALMPDLYGAESYETLFICWGSVLPAAREAIQRHGNASALAHFTQVFPVNPKAKELIDRANQVIVIENNQSAQFTQVLETALHITVDRTILKFNGLQFSVAELSALMKEVV